MEYIHSYSYLPFCEISSIVITDPLFTKTNVVAKDFVSDVYSTFTNTVLTAASLLTGGRYKKLQNVE